MVITSTSGGELRRWFSAAERGFQLAPEVSVVGTTGSPGPETVGFGVGVVGIGVDVVVVKVVGIAAGAISVAVGGFVSSGFRGSFVGTPTLTTTVASGDGVSAI
jgi:hypothetical protein